MLRPAARSEWTGLEGKIGLVKKTPAPRPRAGGGDCRPVPPKSPNRWQGTSNLWGKPKKKSRPSCARERPRHSLRQLATEVTAGQHYNQAELMKLAAELGQEVEFDDEQEGLGDDDIDQDPP